METSLEHVLINFYKEGMIAYMHSHPEEFEEAVNLAISEKQPFSWRAAWLLWSCMEKNDTRIRKHIKRIIKSIKDKSDGHKRELIKILLEMHLNEEQEGLLFDLCISLWKKNSLRPSVRHTALKMILKIAKNHPELEHEISLLMQNQYMDSLSPGIKMSVIKMIKEFNSNK